MKNLNKFLLLAIFSVLFVSCNTDEASTTEVAFSPEDNLRAAQADNAIDGALNIVENGYVEGEEGRSAANSFFTECTLITIQPNGDMGAITLDFGAGCQLNNGALVAGKVIIDYGPFSNGSRAINYQYTDFSYNGNGVEGGGQVVREIANDDGNPQATVNETILVSFPNTDVTATRNGMRVSEWIEGVGSGTWQDNVYAITGNWDTELTNGFNRTGLVTETLIRKLNCPYLVSGVLEITQNSFTGVIDWGDGACDNMALLIYNNQEFELVL